MCSKVGVSSDIDGFGYGNDAFQTTTNSKDSNDSVAAWVKNVHVPLVEVQVLFGYGNIE